MTMLLKLLVCLVVALASAEASDFGEFDGAKNEQTHIKKWFEELKKSGYDKSVMPVGNSKSGYPVNVRCEMYLLDISEVDDLNMEYRAMFYFRQIWNDTRLAFPNPPIDFILLDDPSLIWTPDLFSAQEKEGIHHRLIAPNTLIKIYSDGEVKYSVRLSMTFRCPMDFTKYPHDVQKCNFQVESYGSTRDRLSLSWNQGTPVSFNKNISIVNFALKEVQESEKHVVFKNAEYTQLHVSLKFQRKTGFFTIRLYAPFLLLSAISWLCFWIPAKMLALRIPLLLVVLYLMVHTGVEINGRAPPVSYIKASDVWIAVCECLVFASFLETIAVHILYRKTEKNMCKSDPESQSVLEKDEKMNRVHTDSSTNLVASRLSFGRVAHKRIDRISAFLFPSLFVIFNFVYGFVYCCRRQ